MIPEDVCTLIHRLVEGGEPCRGRGGGGWLGLNARCRSPPRTRGITASPLCAAQSEQPAALRHRRRLRAGWCTAAISKRSVVVEEGWRGEARGEQGENDSERGQTHQANKRKVLNVVENRSWRQFGEAPMKH